MRELPEGLPDAIAVAIRRIGLEGRDDHIARKGWRYWYWTPFGLMSGFRGRRDGPWSLRSAAVAACVPPVSGRPRNRHRAPDPNCYCGIRATIGLYALRSWRLPKRPNTVVGEVLLWGRVIERNKVLYGELAYPMSLSVLTDTFQDDYLGPAIATLGEYGVAVSETSYERAGGNAKRPKAVQLRGGVEVERNLGERTPE